MSYLVLARKYRPAVFEDVIGQEHVTRTLINAINLNKVHHAYIFTGPRGVGKTTVSRILAKALNCKTGITATPCNKCSNCLEIDQGNSFDVKEIDGASNRGIDEIRELRDDIKFTPASCRKKVYIIDEVHMLTNQAFNALLKTLEEPPSHAVFIFATTEINEVPATILSRCQRHDFKRIAVDVLVKSLKKICDSENIVIDKESLFMIAQAGDGSVRDSESILDQVIAYSGNEITHTITSEALGIAGFDILFDYLDIKLAKNTKELLNFVASLASKGINYEAFMKGLADFFRNFLILKSGADHTLLTLTEENVAKLIKYKDLFTDEDLLYYLDLLSKGFTTLKNSGFQRIDFEIILLKIVLHERSSNLSEIIEKMDKFTEDLEYTPEELLKELRPTINIVKEKHIKQITLSDEKIITNSNKEDIKKNIIKKNDDKPEEKNEVILKAISTNEQKRSKEKPVLLENKNLATLSESEKECIDIKEKKSQNSSNLDTQEAVTKKELLSKNTRTETTEKNESSDISNNIDSQKKVEHDIPSIEKTDTNILNLAKIKGKWKYIVTNVGKNYPSLGKFMDYPVPYKFDDNILTLKFSKEHNPYYKFCIHKKSEFTEAINKTLSLEKNHRISIELVLKEINEDERIVKIKQSKIMSQKEKQDFLLEKAPQLKFLFENPINGKIV